MGAVGREHRPRARAWARLVGVPPDRVATGATVSGLVGHVAAAIPDGARVVAPEVDFASLLFPFLAQAHRGVEVETVPLERLADAVDGRTTAVAFSAVQSATGELADLDAVEAAAREHGALTIVDATQACGWLPFDGARFDAVACAGYKWLLAPRGTAYLALGDDLLERVRPLAAGWWAGEDPARVVLRAAAPPRLERAPARHLARVVQLGRRGAGARAARGARRRGDPGPRRRRWRTASAPASGLPPGESAIVSTSMPDAAERLERAGIRAAVRASSLRVSFHVYNTEADVDAALDALTAVSAARS